MCGLNGIPIDDFNKMTEILINKGLTYDNLPLKYKSFICYFIDRPLLVKFYP